MTAAPCIETERLLLSWPSTEQIDDYYLAIAGTDMFDTILWDGPSRAQDLHDFWQHCRDAAARTENGLQEVAIIDKTSQRYIGGTGLRPTQAHPGIFDVGYALAPYAHGNGYATEAVRALVAAGFAERGAERIFAGIFVGNLASRRVVEKIGFKYEGTLRRSVCKRGIWLDEWLLALTRPDWEAR